ncbi:MAG: ribonuclease HI [Firmicutes bacterium]|uniref:ribonuclease H n=1 Tax=Sulfobacillus benefaciens TaxID=453960 RepID=A0A2T2X8E2_9FIRM|nr:ribonuclease HI [Bacillota bacterium]MCL5012578.1 ribonuclease HI [Bacillota bacterium]PSR30718.1 MAG: ribonuclease HI [Sulfobacillus benefaciens]
MTYRVYTDGACANNQAPGGQPGGWACLFEGGSAYSGAEPHTTNNRMEMTAVIEALQHTPKGACVSVYSDSAYVINAFKQNWFGGWEKRGWRNAKGQPVENQDLWRRMLALVSERKVDWYKVKGHSGNPLNEMADRLAVEAMEELRRKL